MVAQSQIVVSGCTATLLGTMTNETGFYVYFCGMPPDATTWGTDGIGTTLFGAANVATDELSGVFAKRRPRRGISPGGSRGASSSRSFDGVHRRSVRFLFRRSSWRDHGPEILPLMRAERAVTVPSSACGSGPEIGGEKSQISHGRLSWDGFDPGRHSPNLVS